MGEEYLVSTLAPRFPCHYYSNCQQGDAPEVYMKIQKTRDGDSTQAAVLIRCPHCGHSITGIDIIEESDDLSKIFNTHTAHGVWNSVHS